MPKRKKTISSKQQLSKRFPKFLKFNKKHFFIFPLAIATIIALTVLYISLLPFIKQSFPSQSQLGTSQNREVKILVLKYFPQDPSRPGYLDPSIVGPDLGNWTITQIGTQTDLLTNNTKDSLTRGSIFREYRNPSAVPYLTYTVHSVKEYSEPVPRSANPIPWNPAAYRPDYIKILNRENICNLVDNLGVNQVWLWGYHYKDIDVMFFFIRIKNVLFNYMGIS